jgi:putative membrane protein
MMGGYGGYGMFGAGSGFGWVFMILWWGLIIAGIAVLVRWFFSSSTGRSGAGHTALDILKERYARGEIDREEYEQKRRDLER